MRKLFILFLILAVTIPVFTRRIYCVDTGADNHVYNAKGKRDPFIPLIGQEKKKITGLEGVASLDELTLEGIAIGALGKRIAIMNGQMVRENDVFGMLLIKKISQKSVDLSIDGKDYRLELQEPEEKNKSAK